MKIRSKILKLAVTAAMLALSACAQEHFTATGGNGNVVPLCNPFGGSPGIPGHGLIADLHYLTADQKSSPFNDVNDYITNSKGQVSNPLYFTDINVPTRYWAGGLTDQNGTAVIGSDGTSLTEYFGFHAVSTFVLGDWAPGDYQLAVLSDDGSITTLKGAGGGGTDLVINNDGTHPTQMGCTSTILHVDRDSSYPMTFNYYQGPRISIAFMLLARPYTAGMGLDPLCGQGAQDDAYFFNDHGYPAPTVPQQPYLDLLNRGWQPVDPTHFVLPSGNNPCV